MKAIWLNVLNDGEPNHLDVVYERASPDITEFDYDIGNASLKVMAARFCFDARGRVL